MSSVKTYVNKKVQVQSDKALNKLFAVNIGKRRLTRKNARKKTPVIKPLPQRDSECCISDESIHVNKGEDTFDRIMKTSVYRELDYVSVSNLKKYQSDLSSEATNSALPESSFTPVCNSTLNEGLPNDLKEKNFVESTPVKPTKKAPAMNIVLSPITNSQQGLPHNILEKSYEEIGRWDNNFPDISDFPSPKRKKFAISRTFAKSVKLNLLDDWKLKADVKVNIEKTIDLLGVISSVHIQSKRRDASDSLSLFKNSSSHQSDVSEKLTGANCTNGNNDGLEPYYSDHQYSRQKHILYISKDHSESCDLHLERLATNDTSCAKTPIDFRVTRRSKINRWQSGVKKAKRNLESDSDSNEIDENGGCGSIIRENADEDSESTKSATSNLSLSDNNGHCTDGDEISSRLQENDPDPDPSEKTQNKSEDVLYVATYNCETKDSHSNTKETNSNLAVLEEKANDPVIDLTEDKSDAVQTPHRAHLKSGKLWKRSLSVYKMFNSIYEIPNTGNVSVAADSVVCSNAVKNRRTTMKIELLNETKTKLNCTVLESYAMFGGYDSDQEDRDKSDLERIIDDYTTVLKHLYLTSSANKLQTLSAKDIVLQKCGQMEVLPFEERFPSYQLQHCRKIGEGVYGEVFLWRIPNGGTSVLKIIPIEGSLTVNNCPQKKFSEVLSEIIIIKELSDLREKRQNRTSAFCEVKQIDCLKGKYPERLLYLWELYDEMHQSENDSPEMFGDDQLYIVLELQNGGTDLEMFKFESAAQMYSILKQITYALAVAETELQFEHRDLHWGNILISNCDPGQSLYFCLDGKSTLIESHGVQASIIDFTLSRITCDGVVIYNDLSTDLDLFNAEGDYQFEIYRLMQKENKNNWKTFTPYTNVLWLHYLFDKVLKKARVQVKNPSRPFMKELRSIKAKLLKCKSAKDVATNLFK